jgi:hypothetical protein
MRMPSQALWRFLHRLKIAELERYREFRTAFPVTSVHSVCQAMIRPFELGGSEGQRWRRMRRRGIACSRWFTPG